VNLGHVLILAVVEGVSLRDLAPEYGVSYETVRTWLKKALNKARGEDE